MTDEEKIQYLETQIILLNRSPNGNTPYVMNRVAGLNAWIDEIRAGMVRVTAGGSVR